MRKELWKSSDIMMSLKSLSGFYRDEYSWIGVRVVVSYRTGVIGRSVLWVVVANVESGNVSKRKVNRYT